MLINYKNANKNREIAVLMAVSILILSPQKGCFLNEITLYLKGKVQSKRYLNSRHILTLINGRF